jgi:hypothetical protein
LAAGTLSLLLLCAWIYYLNRNTPPPVEIVTQAPPVVEDPLPEPVIPTDVPPAASEVSAWQKQLLGCIRSARKKCTPEKVEAFQKLLQTMPDHINDPLVETQHRTILHYVAKAGPAQFVAVMAEFNIDFGIQESTGFQNTALHWAIANGKNWTAREIIQHAPPQTLSLQAWRGNTPLHLAIAKGYTTHTKDGVHIRYSNFDLTRELITKGASVDISNQDGNTPLHLACARRDIATMKLLIANGAKIDTRNNKHQTPWDLLLLEHEHACALLEITARAFLLDKDLFVENKQQAKDILLYAGASPSLRKEIDRDRRLIDRQMEKIENGLFFGL